MTDGTADILKNDDAPTPPAVPSMTNKSNTADDDAQARAVMGLPPKSN